MRKLPLYVCSKSSPSKDELEKLTRKYHTLNFEDITITQQLLKKLKKSNVLKEIRELVMIECSVAEEAFRILLKSCSAVEKILILSSSVSSPKKRDMVDLSSLKCLVVMESHFDYFNFFGKTNLKELKIHDQTYLLKKPEDFEKFLKRVGTMESLAIRVKSGEIFKCLKNSETKSFEFKLKKLSVTFGGFGSGSEHDTNFEDILKDHKETLTSMEIESKLHEDTYELILRDLKLKFLRMDCRFLPASNIFYSPIAPNIYLQKLVVTKGEELLNFNSQFYLINRIAEFEHQNAASGLLRIYKNIQNLAINAWAANTQNEILIAAANLQRLNTLSIPEVPENASELPIPTLATLQLERIGSAAQFQAYVAIHSNIKNISVKWINDELTNEILHAVTRLLRLESIIFGPYFSLSRLSYDTLKQNCPNLQFIHVYKFWDEENPFSPTERNPQVCYFSNNSSMGFFKRDPAVWDVEDWNYHFIISAEDTDYEDSFSDDDDDIDSDMMDSGEDDYFDNDYLFYGGYEPDYYMINPYLY